ncbi:MAG: hypothetical protein K8L97_14595 [Anaerolineae bacterium]|nr:hypothetical protein [Anaerolineae bacterium]
MSEASIVAGRVIGRWLLVSRKNGIGGVDSGFYRTTVLRRFGIGLPLQYFRR